MAETETRKYKPASAAENGSVRSAPGLQMFARNEISDFGVFPTLYCVFSHRIKMRCRAVSALRRARLPLFQRRVVRGCRYFAFAGSAA